jgi:hypothetical protein
MAAVFHFLLGGLLGSADSFGIGLLSSDTRRFGGFRFGSICLGNIAGWIWRIGELHAAELL